MSEDIYVLKKVLGVPDINGKVISPKVMQEALKSPDIQESLKDNRCYVYMERERDPSGAILDFCQNRVEDRLARIEKLTIDMEDGTPTLRASLSSVQIGKIPVEQLVSIRDNVEPNLHVRGFAKLEGNIVKDLKIISFDLCHHPDLG